MSQTTILFPMLAMVLLTLIVWFAMYVTRVRELRAKHIHPQRIASAHDVSELLKAVAGPSDNFNNLFEIPVLFYVICIVLYQLQRVDAIYLILASAFVVGRYAHSLIHITYNRVYHRFIAYVISSAFMWLIWIRLAYQVITA